MINSHKNDSCNMLSNFGIIFAFFIHESGLEQALCQPEPPSLPSSPAASSYHQSLSLGNIKILSYTLSYGCTTTPPLYPMPQHTGRILSPVQILLKYIFSTGGSCHSPPTYPPKYVHFNHIRHS